MPRIGPLLRLTLILVHGHGGRFYMSKVQEIFTFSCTDSQPARPQPTLDSHSVDRPPAVRVDPRPLCAQKGLGLRPPRSSLLGAPRPTTKSSQVMSGQGQVEPAVKHAVKSSMKQVGATTCSAPALPLNSTATSEGPTTWLPGRWQRRRAGARAPSEHSALVSAAPPRPPHAQAHVR